MLYVLAALATWRVTHILLRENGPWSLFRRLRVALGVVYDREDETRVAGFRYEITVCMWCLSLWVGIGATALLWFAPTWAQLAILVPFAVSAVSVMIDKHFGMGSR